MAAENIDYNADFNHNCCFSYLGLKYHHQRVSDQSFH
jgi:hypothetical protein